MQGRRRRVRPRRGKRGQAPALHKSNRERRRNRRSRPLGRRCRWFGRYAKPMECGGPTPLSTRRPDDASRPRPTPPPDAQAPEPSAAKPPATVRQPLQPTTERQSAPRISREEGGRLRAKDVAAGPVTAGQDPPRKAGSGPLHSKAIALLSHHAIHSEACKNQPWVAAPGGKYALEFV